MSRPATLLLILTLSAGLTVLALTSSVVNVFGQAAKNDFGYAIAVDSAGNIIVAGTTESYGAGLDDAFIAKYSPSREQLWSHTWGGSGSDQGYSVAIDSTDNIIVTGQTRSFGAGGSDGFISKYSASGNQLWNTTWGGSNSECGYGVTVDLANNIIVAGYTNSTGAGLEDVFVAKYSSSGVQLWNATWGGYYNDRAHGIAVDSTNNIALVGYTDLTGASFYDALVVKYSSSGLLQWNLTMGGGSDFGYDVAVDSADNAIIAGYKFSPITSSWDAFVAKCHSSGVQLWNRTWGGTSNDRSYGVALDSTDNLVITGETHSFGAGGSDAFILKYSSSGGQLWNTTWGGSGADFGYGVTVDSANNTLIAGYTDSFGAGSGFYDAFILHVSTSPLWQTTWGKTGTDRGRNVVVDSTNNTIITGYTDSAGAGFLDAFIAKYSSSGVQLWNRTWGGNSNDYGYSLVVDSASNIIAVGYTRSYGAGGYDAFIVKYSSSGVQLWNHTWGGNSYDYGYDVAVDSADNMILTGYTRSFGAGGYDAFVAKYSSAGVQLWNNTWGGSNYDYGYGIAVDSADSIVITGATESFGAGGVDAFIVKYSSLGSQLWNITWGGGAGDYGYDVAVDSTNSIVITGQTSLVDGLNDAFIVKYSLSGDPQWSGMWGGSFNDCGYGVAVDSADKIIMTGETYRSAADGIDAFVVKYSSLGVQLWNRAWGGSKSDYGYGVTVDRSNNIVMAGTTESFGAGSSDAFVVKYPSAGFQFWHIIWEASPQKVHDVAVVSLSPSKTTVGQGYTVNINVNVTNQGQATETFSVTTYYNSTEIGTQTVVDLSPNSNATLTFAWQSASVPLGYYTISANATPVSGEFDLSDNSVTDGTVMVTIPGDVNSDKTVNILDAGAVSAHWHTPPAPPGPLGYDPNVDINNDGKINILDAAVVNANWQKSW